MKSLRWLSLSLLMCITALAFAGDVQVSCAPGLRVFLDGKLMGTSNAKQDGLFLVKVANGKHTIRVEKDGFLPQTFEVEVFDLPVEVKVEALEPAPAEGPPEASPRVEVRELVGSLVVTSAPQNCEVEVDGHAQAKSTPQLQVGGLAAGQHTISFRKPGFDPISGAVTVRPGVEVTVRGDLLAGKVEVVHSGMGSLLVTSNPVFCTIQFMGKTYEKEYSRFRLTKIPAGEHELAVAWGGRQVTAKVTIANGQRAVVAVSFMPGDRPWTVSYEPQ